MSATTDDATLLRAGSEKPAKTATQPKALRKGLPSEA